MKDAVAGCTTLRASASTPKPVDALARSVCVKRIVLVTRQIGGSGAIVSMRGEDEKQASMLCLISPSDRIPKDHPIRKVKELADAGLRDLSRVFDKMYNDAGRPSIPPERLLKSMLLIAEPAHSKADRGVLGLDEDDRQFPTEPLQGNSPDAIRCIPRRRGIQPAAHCPPGGDVTPRCSPVPSRGR